jgi:microsomal dipeptidase-like Zn-dependent dipeptidase
MSQTGTPAAITAALLLFCAAAAAVVGAPAVADDDAAMARARALLARQPLIDGHNDLAWAIRENARAPRDVLAYDLRTRTPGNTDLQRLGEGGVGGQLWSVYVPAEMDAGFPRVQLEQIDLARRVIAGYPDQRNGGVVIVTFVSAFVSAEYARHSDPLWKEYERRALHARDEAERERIRKEVFARMPRIEVTIAQVADHVDRVREVAGVDHVGIGGDYDGNDAWPRGLEDVSGYPRLFAELVRRGWSDEDLGKLASGNFLRALREAEAVSKRLAATRPPSNASIEALDTVAGRP